ncbi:TetR/AcrR family transcriptional regulator [Brevibacterium linens]|uniref:TetR/AcrR family transcriptional regulator n=1 Tax=Brevibacterium linens TaxID=1703 RepID=UPI0035131B36
MKQKMRKDVVRNNRAILKAAGEMIREDPDSLNIHAVAEKAGLSVPTVYRYYPSAEAILGRYMIEVDAQIRDFSHECDICGPELFDAVLAEWGEIIAVYGPGLVQIRSRRGFFERLDIGDEAMEIVRSAWERPIRRLMAAHGINDVYFYNALFVFNMMFDPREMLDLTRRGLTMTETLEVLKDGYIGALKGWQASSAMAIARHPQ